MKKSIKLSCVALFAALFFGLVSAGTGRTKAAAGEFEGGGGAESRSLYLSNCARCHGADGSSDTELGRLNDTPPINGGKARRMSSASLTRLVTRGKASMPGFGKKLTKAQIASIVAYARSL